MDIKKKMADLLVDIKESTTYEERMAAVRDIPISRPTLYKYLNGDVIKLDTAERIVDYFRPLVKKRGDKISVPIEKL